MSKNTTNLRSRIAAASRAGGSSFLRQLKEIPRKTNNDGTTTEKEGIVEKLQGVLVAVRRDRDREHRSRDIAMEKLRSATKAFESDKSNVEAEKAKLAKTQEEAERIQKEIKEKEESIRQLQEKYQFQHEDLNRKREKIQQEITSQDATESKQEELMDQASNHLDRERKKSEELKRSEEAESKHLLDTMARFANGEKNESVAQVEKEADDKYLHRLLEFLEANGTDETNTKDGGNGKADKDNKSDLRREFDTLHNLRSKHGDLFRFLEPLEKKNIEYLTRELKAGIDLYELSSIISNKTQTLEMEIEFMEAELAMPDAEKEKEQQKPTMEESPKEDSQGEQKKQAEITGEETVVDEAPKDGGQEDEHGHVMITDLEGMSDEAAKDDSQEEQEHQPKLSDHEASIKEAPKDGNQEEQDQEAAIALLTMVQEEAKDDNENTGEAAIKNVK